MLRKKALKSNVEWGPVHGEIELLKKLILFFAFFLPMFTKGILAKLNDLESESDFFSQNEGQRCQI